jgi:hypothetical protein
MAFHIIKETIYGSTMVRHSIVAELFKRVFSENASRALDRNILPEKGWLARSPDLNPTRLLSMGIFKGKSVLVVKVGKSNNPMGFKNSSSYFEKRCFRIKFLKLRIKRMKLKGGYIEV